MTRAVRAGAAPPEASRRGRRVAVRAALVAALTAGIAGALTIGPVAVSLGEPVQSLAHHLGLATEPPPNDGVLWAIRFPRVLLAAIVGAALGLAGVALQGLYRTSLADPQLLGIGPGAAMGAVIGTAFGAIQGGIAGGAVAGMVTGIAIRRIGGGAADATRFVLVGVALAAALSAWVGFLVFGFDRSVIPSIDFWLLGSLSGATWRAVGTVTVLVALGAGVIAGFARSLDVLTLGDTNATAVGVDVPLTQTAVLLAVGAMTGSAVGAAGVVGFVGLIAPAIVSPFVGPSHAHRLTGGAAAGALVVLIADTFARTVAAPVEMPVGLVTAAIGGPLVIWLITRSAAWT